MADHQFYIMANLSALDVPAVLAQAFQGKTNRPGFTAEGGQSQGAFCVVNHALPGTGQHGLQHLAFHNPQIQAGAFYAQIPGGLRDISDSQLDG